MGKSLEVANHKPCTAHHNRIKLGSGQTSPPAESRQQAGPISSPATKPSPTIRRSQRSPQSLLHPAKLADRSHSTRERVTVRSAQNAVATATTPRNLPSKNSVRHTGFANRVNAVRFSISLKNNCAVSAMVNAAPNPAIAPSPKSAMNLSSEAPKLKSRQHLHAGDQTHGDQRKHRHQFLAQRLAQRHRRDERHPRRRKRHRPH